MSVAKKVPESIQAKIDNLISLNSHDDMKVAVNEIVQELQSIRDNSNVSSVSYLQGYVLYLHPDRQHSEQVRFAAEEALLAAVDADPNNALAWLYLGHNSYDFGDYATARERFSRVDSKLLKPYLAGKAHEFFLCCEIICEGLQHCFNELDCFVEFVEHSDPDDLMPIELARVLRKSVSSLTEFDAARFRAIMQKLDRAGNFEPWFALIMN